MLVGFFGLDFIAEWVLFSFFHTPKAVTYHKPTVM